MWARAVELMLGCWLAISPFVFRHAPTAHHLWVNDLVAGALVATLALLSFRRVSEKAHLGSIAVGLWLIAFAYLQPEAPSSVAAQNYMVTGLLLVMLAVLPSFSEAPPAGWRAFNRERSERSERSGAAATAPTSSPQSHDRLRGQQ